MVVIQNRDREILRVCYEQQFLLFEHLEQFFFKGKVRQKVYERIKELEKIDLIQREQSIAFGRNRVIRLTQNGVGLVRAGLPVAIPQFRKLNLQTLVHDAIVTSVRLRLAELWDGKWIPEGLLKKKEYLQIPDGIVAFTSGKKIAIEIENSLKGKTRFQELMNTWANGSGTEVGLVLYVATTPTLFKSIEVYLTEAPRKPIFALVEWEQLRTGAPKVVSPHGVIDLFSRRSF